MSRKKESKAYTITKNSCKNVGGFIHKIQDTPPFENSKYMIKKPFDQFFVWNGHAWFIEFKYLPNFAAFSLKNLREHQVTALEEIHNNRAENIKPIIGLFLYRPREIKRIYFFDYEFLKNKPYKKADLIYEEKYFEVKKEAFDFLKISYNLIS